MKRREFLKTSSVLIGGLALSKQVRAAGCPPAGLGALGGASGPPVDCPRPPVERPSWVDSLNLNQWTPLPNSNVFRDVWAENIGQYGNTGPASVLITWCGAAYARHFGPSGSMIHWGGGHQDYYGNEVYSFDLNTLTWERLTDPSPHATGGTIPDGIYPDNTPGASHTRYQVTARSTENQLVIVRRETTNLGGGGSYKMTYFDLDTRTWFNSRNSTGVNANQFDGCVYDSKRDTVWQIVGRNSGLQWASYDWDDDSWRSYTLGGQRETTSIVYCPTTDYVVVFRLRGSPFILDPNRPTTESALASSGSAPTESHDNMAIWSSNLGAIVYYPSRSSSIYKLTPPDGDWRTDQWTWSQLPVSGSSGIHTGSAGTFSKFQLVEWGGATVCLLNANVEGPCYALRVT